MLFRSRFQIKLGAALHNPLGLRKILLDQRRKLLARHPLVWLERPLVQPGPAHLLLKDARPERIKQEVVGSLRRLRRDVLDLYYLHRPDPEVPFEDSYGALADLVRDGLVRALGLSEVGVDHLERAWAIHPFAALQSEFSLWTRGPLDDVIP